MKSRSNIDKIVKRRLAVASTMFAVRHPFTEFDTKAARRKIHKQVTKRMGTSLYVPHQGAQEKARRVRQGLAPFEYSQELELDTANFNHFRFR